MGFNGGKDLAHLGLLPILFQILTGSWRLNLLRVGIGILQRMIFLDDLGSRLLPHSRYSGNIIGRIPHQSFHIDKLSRGDAIPLFHLLPIVILHLGPSLFCLGDPDLHMIRGKLERIPVPGYDRHIQPLLLALSGDRSQQIVRFQARLFNDLDSHCF